MDSVLAPTERRHLGVTTALAALVLAAFVALMLWLQYGGSGVDGVEEPERSLALIVGRTMDLDDAITRAPTWERWFYRLVSSDPADDLAESIRWYEELAGTSLDATVDLNLAILEAAAGRLDDVRRRTAEWLRRPEPLPDLALLVGAAYLDAPMTPDDAGAIEATVAALEPDWFRDRLAEQLAARLGDRELLDAATTAQAARSARLLVRIRAMVATELLFLSIGLIALVRLAWRRGALPRVAAAAIPPPWRGRAGVVVLVHGGALGALTVVAFYFYAVVDPERPFANVFVGAVTNLAFVPVLFLAHRHLVRPSGLGFGASFGLTPARDAAAKLALAFVTLLAIGQLGQLVIDLTARGLGVSAHWTEWFDRDLVWGPPVAVVATVFDTVVLTPVFEEIVFRGLVFGTLRRRFGLPTAAVLSAAVFAVAHGYGVLGFAAVFWSGLLWAWAYERTGSLWPSIGLHAADNLMATLSVIVVLRG
jgi:membrane protease YdiL (CAAX protease family)